MLVIQRKIGEQIVIPQRQITIEVLGCSGGRVRLGISAPTSTAVHRSEVWATIQQTIDSQSASS
jgi:carbon storage regulator